MHQKFSYQHKDSRHKLHVHSGSLAQVKQDFIDFPLVSIFESAGIRPLFKLEPSLASWGMVGVQKWSLQSWSETCREGSCLNGNADPFLAAASISNRSKEVESTGIDGSWHAWARAVRIVRGHKYCWGRCSLCLLELRQLDLHLLLMIFLTF